MATYYTLTPCDDTLDTLTYCIGISPVDLADYVGETISINSAPNVYYTVTSNSEPDPTTYLNYINLVLGNEASCPVLDLDLGLNFCASIIDSCSKLKITDITGIYHEDNNPDGWGEDAITVSSNIVTEATIQINDDDPIDVLDQIPNTITGNFDFTTIDLDDYEDGEMTITYIIVANGQTYSKELTFYFTCSARCCVDKMWAKVAEKLCGDCNCNPYGVIKEALMAESLLSAIQSSASCTNSTARDNMLEQVNKLCDWASCGCD